MRKEYLPAFVVLTLISLNQNQALADESKLTAQGSTPVKQSLENLKGKSVSLRLRSGEDLAGQVADVGDKAVVLTQLTGKEFFDAVITLDSIDAVTSRAK
jgi:hypothetical protein